MTLRLTDEESDALRRRAEVEGHERTDDVDAAAAWVTTNFREALDRLGRA